MLKRKIEELQTPHVSTIDLCGVKGTPVCVAGDSQGGSYIATSTKIYAQLDCGRYATLYNSIVFEEISSIAVGPFREIVVVDSERHSIYKISRDSITTRVAGSSSGDYGRTDGIDDAAKFHSPHTVLYMPVLNTYYISDVNNNCIRSMNPVTWNVQTVCGNSMQHGNADGEGVEALFHEPMGMTIFDDRSFIVADHRNDSVRKVTIDLDNKAHVSTMRCEVRYPLSLAVDGDKNIVAISSGHHHIHMLTLNTNTNQYDGKIMSGKQGFNSHKDGDCEYARFNHPIHVRIDDRGRVVICERINAAGPKTCWLRVIEFGLTPCAATTGSTQMETSHNVMKQMLVDGLFTDVVITVGGGGKLKAHASILYCHSSFFRSQIENMIRVNSRATLKIYLINLSSFNINLEQLKIFVNYVYTNELPDLVFGKETGLGVTPLDMIRVADMMLNEKLCVLCVKQFALSLNMENIEALSDLAWELGLSKPKHEVLAFYIKNPSLVKSIL